MKTKSNIIINGSGLNYTAEALVTITADNVDMSGFTVTNALQQGIQVESSQYCEVHDNIVCFTGDRGIVFGDGGNNSAYNNVVYNISAHGSIEAIWSNNNTIYNNLAYFNEWGIATNNGSYNLIYNNTVYSSGSGIHLDWSSTGNMVYNNNFSSNTASGISFGNQASENIISGNEISGNNENGIGLYHSSNNTLSGNNITANNYNGVWLGYSSSYNTISGNNIINNQYGVGIQESSDNVFYHNNFVNNVNQTIIATSSSNTWDAGYPIGGNYWSNYNGTDADQDGIGDIPYVIDSNNTDNYPLMKPYGGPYDIGITNITTSKTVVGQGYSLNITMKILNYGINTETFNLTVYANTTTIQTITNVVLTSRNSTSINLTWNTTGVPYGNYTISANAIILEGETDIVDNTLIDGWVVVTIAGDADGSGRVVADDFFILVDNFGERAW
ncbi:MAG: right-handed parallel beta-helix repeat-containing protein [Candidatus Bathyarchaeota archaeon]|nr:MAG: right-handed parallel beta-helix repeat-containing protein [Candidatus Bathyarchaeota archaeon]